jgi:uncharacterized repeat protein (TIGR02543 family)
VACSADGNQIFATVSGGPIYISRDAGLTWLPSTAPSGAWLSVACSSDGGKVLAAQYDYNTPGPLYVSTDSGATWSTSDPLVDSWTDVAVSANGTLMFANGGSTHLSTNSGATWDSVGQPVGNFAISGDGQRLMGFATAQSLYVSTNSGLSGVSFDLPPLMFQSIAASGDGLSLVAGLVCSLTYTSEDGGTNWTPVPNVGGGQPLVVAESRNGAWRLAMQNEGATWISYVPDSAPFFGQQPPASTVGLQTTTAQLGAQLLGSTPMYLQWQCNGTNVLDSDRISGATNLTLTISNLQLSDSGTYTLVATNAFGSALSQSAQLTVNPDLQKPLLSVFSPKNRQRVFGESLFQVQGWSTDNARVAGVWFQLNSGPWVLATIDYGAWLYWSGNLSPVSGTNTLRCYAMDLAGNCSLTNTVTFTAVIQSMFSVTQNGPGKLKPNYGTQILNIDEKYTMRAEPAPGYIFAGWTGGIQSQQQKLTFTMQSNLVLQANFVTNPFPPLAGTYSGVASGTVQPVPVGPTLFSAVVGRKREFAARLTLNKQVFHCSGQLSPTGFANVSFSGPGDFQPNGGTLQLDLSGSGILKGEFESEGLYSGELQVFATKQ